MCSSEGCQERAQVLADETDQQRRPHDGMPHRGSCDDCGALLTVANDAEGRSVGEAARVVPVKRLEELAEEFTQRHDRLTFAAANASTSEERHAKMWSSRAEAWSIAAADLRAVIADHATTVDPVTTRSGFTGRGESDGTAPEAPEGTPDDSAGAESVSVVERAARVIADHEARTYGWTSSWEDSAAHRQGEILAYAQALADAGLLLTDPADPPAAPEPSGDVVEQATQVLYDVHGAEPHIKAHALADAGLLASTSSTRAALDEDNARLTRERDRARDERDEALRERDEAKDRHSKLYASFTRMSRDLRGQRNDAQAEARAAHQEGERLREALRAIRRQVGTSTQAWRTADAALSDGGDQ